MLFISHSSQDAETALRVRDWLFAQGHTEVFLDIDAGQGLAPGQFWKEELKKAGGACSAVLVLLSPDWAASPWCRSEFLTADLMGKRIFPLMVRPTSIDSLPNELIAHLQIADISSPEIEAEGFERLAVGLERAGLAPGSFPWPPADEPNRMPYRGLKALDVVDAGIFFGRESATTQALDMLRQMRGGAPERILVLLGASGAGKSSLLRAGLLARLRNETQDFAVLPILRPGNAALTGRTGLTKQMGREIATTDDLCDVFAAERAKSEARRALLDHPGGRPATIILPIDQAEELHAVDNHEAGRAMDLIGRAVKADGNALIVLTIRSDSYSALQSEPAFEALPKLLFDLPPLRETAFQQVIEGPGRLATPPILVDSALTDALLNDLDEADALPLLAFTLERLDALRRAAGGRALTLADYRDTLKGLGGAIRSAVDAALSLARDDPALPDTIPDLLTLAQRVFLPELVALDHPKAEARRRVALRARMPADVQPMIDHLVTQRLLVTDTDKATGAQSVEVAHEAILRHWTEFQDWLVDERDFLVGRERMEALLRDWQDLPADKQRGGLLRGVLLDRARGWVLAHPERFAGTGLRSFIAASDRAQREEAAVIEAQRALAKRRGKMIVGISMTAAVILAGLTWWALGQRQDALQQTERAVLAEEDALRQAEIAETNATIAEDNATRAAENAARAEENAREAEENARQAEENAALARAEAAAAEAARAAVARESELKSDALERLAAERDRATRNFATAKTSIDALIFDIVEGLRNVEGMSLAARRRILGQAEVAMDKLLAGDPDNPELLRSKAAMLLNFSDLFVGAGDGEPAEERLTEATELLRSLAARDPENAQGQRDLSVSLNKIGDLRLRAGDAPGALAAYEEWQGISRSLAARDPENAEWQRDVFVSLDRIGDLRLRAGDAPGALAAYDEGLEIARSLAARDPENAEWQRDVFVSLNRIGDLRLRAGDAPGALAAFDESMEIARSLAARDPEKAQGQRDVSVSLERIGDLRLQAGDAPGALAAYDEGLEIRRSLAALDADNVQAQTDLVISLFKMSGVQPTTDAIASLTQAQEILANLSQRGLLTADQQAWPAALTELIENLRLTNQNDLLPPRRP